MADYLNWATVYKFDEEVGAYVVTPCNEEMDQEECMPTEPGAFSTEYGLSDSDLDDEDDQTS